MYTSEKLFFFLLPKDEGVYRCRVDYEDSPTRNYKVNLSIIGNRIRFCITMHLDAFSAYFLWTSCNNLSFSVPPSSPRIRNQGQELITNGRLGPVAENELIDLTCDTVGGR